MEIPSWAAVWISDGTFALIFSRKLQNHKLSTVHSDTFFRTFALHIRVFFLFAARAIYPGI